MWSVRSVRLSRSMPIAVALRRRWRLPLLTHLSTFSPFFCRPNRRLPDCSVSSSPSLNLDIWLPDRSTLQHQQSRSISLIPAHSHAPRCRIPLFTFSIIAATSAHPTSLISINTRFLRSPFCQLPRFYRLSNNPLAVVVHLTAASHLSHPFCTRLHPTIVERVDGHLALPVVSLRDTSSLFDIDTPGTLDKRYSRRPVLPDDQPSSWPWTSNTLPTVQPEALCTCFRRHTLNTPSTRFPPSSKSAALCRVLPRSPRVTIWSQGLPRSLLHALVCRVH